MNFLTKKRCNWLVSCIDWHWLMGWVFAAAALATRIVSAECCPPRFPVSQHQTVGRQEAFKANITGDSNPRERRVSAVHIAIRPSWERAVFAPDKPFQVRCQEGFLALTSPNRSWRSQTVTVSWHTAAIMLPFVLQQFCVRWALNPVSAHPPSCLKKKMKIDLCSLFSSYTHVSVTRHLISARILGYHLPRALITPPYFSPGQKIWVFAFALQSPINNTKLCLQLVWKISCTTHTYSLVLVYW